MKPKRWPRIANVEQLERFFVGLLPRLRRVARRHGYALGVHGSLRRDLDLIAAPWVERFSDKDVLVRALQSEATGGIVSARFVWTRKAHGRFATSVPVCWTHERMGNRPNLGHIDLSVAPTDSLYHEEVNKVRP